MDNFVKYLLIVINFIGFLIGLNSYLPQLSQTNIWLWIFIIDCPLAAILFIIFLLGFNNPYFEALMRAYAFKYGLWTILVTISSPILMAYEYSGLNILLHAGLIIESFLFAKKRLSIKNFIPAGLILFANDFSDYFLKTHPYINNDLFLETALLTFSLTIITIIIFLIFYKNKKSII